MQKLVGTLLIFTILLGFGFATIVAGATQTILFVDNTDPTCTDDGSSVYCTIQAAINDTPTGTVPPTTIELEGGPYTEAILIVSRNIDIRGNGVTLDGTGTNRVVFVSQSGRAQLAEMTITNGSDSTGGGVYVAGSSILTGTQLTISDNVATDYGGGIMVNGGSLVLTDSSVVDNSVAGMGGGLAMSGAAANVRLERVLFSGNSAETGGAIGGIGTLSSEHTTISGNSATTVGGGIYTYSIYGIDSLTSLRYVTIVDNDAQDGGGIYADVTTGGTATINLANSILIGNSVTGVGNIECGSNGGTVVSSGYNIRSGGALGGCNGSWGGSDIISSNFADDIDLTLADNGGDTLTHALTTNSVARDTIYSVNNPSLCSYGSETDQRGIVRGNGISTAHACDSGAFEYEHTPTTRSVNGNAFNCNDTTGSPYFCTIQAAVDAAGNGDTVLIEPALYVESVIVPDYRVLTLAGNPSRSSAPIVIVGANSQRVLYVGLRTTVTVQAVTLDNGFVFDDGANVYVEVEADVTLDNVIVRNGTADRGGGIFNAGTLTINDSTIEQNDANSGGGIFNDGTLSVLNGTIADNTATEGGGIEFGATGQPSTLDGVVIEGNSAEHCGGVLLNDDVTMTTVTINANSATDGTFDANDLNGGGGVCVVSGDLTMTDSTISNNYSAQNGGGIHAKRVFGGTGNVVISNTHIMSNTALSSGGGLFAADSGRVVSLTQVTVSANRATDGGGITNETEMTLTDCTLANNEAVVGAGGGWFNDGDGDLTMQRCQVFANRAAQGGGINNRATAYMTQSVLYDNVATYDGGGAANSVTFYFDNSTFSGNIAGRSGGALLNHGTSASVDAVAHGYFNTIVNNSADTGGGIYTLAPVNYNTTTKLYGSIVAANSVNSGNADCIISGSFAEMEGTYNLFVTSAGCETAIADTPNYETSDITQDIELTLADNGGDTLTYAVIGGGSADDVIEEGIVNCGDYYDYDQRGEGRPGDFTGLTPLCDIGAYELPSFTPPTVVTINAVGTQLNQGWLLLEIGIILLVLLTAYHLKRQ